MANEDQFRRVDPVKLEQLVQGIYAGLGIPADDAATLAHALVDADLRGVHSHGCRYVSTYAKVILLTYLVAKDPQWMAQFDAIGNRGHELAGRPEQTKVDTSGVTAIETGARDVSATPPVYYEPTRIGSRPVRPPWQ